MQWNVAGAAPPWPIGAAPAISAIGRVASDRHGTDALALMGLKGRKINVLDAFFIRQNTFPKCTACQNASRLPREPTDGLLPVRRLSELVEKMGARLTHAPAPIA